MNKIYCLGEALIDLYDDEACVGGAPLNVAACAAKLGGQSAFIGGISRDGYGKSIVDTLADVGVDMTYARLKDAPTAIAKVTVKDGDRFFTFERDSTADLLLTEEDVADIPFKEGDALHFCSNCLMDERMRKAHDLAISLAKRAGATISFDVNLRPSLWRSTEDMLKETTKYLSVADIVKFSEEEREALVSGFHEAESGYAVGDMFDKCSSARCVIETRAEKGARCLFKEDVKNGIVAYNDALDLPSLNPSPLDTVGAGDCFVGATLASLYHDVPFKQAMEKALEFAQAACALSVSRRGAIRSYPTLDEVYSSKYIKTAK